MPFKAPLKPLLDWLRSAPIEDPIDRRNAPVMQLLLLFYALVLPLNWAWRIHVQAAIPEPTRLVLLMDLLISVLAIAGIALIRHGHFRAAVKLFIAPQLLSLALTFWLVGVESQLIDPTPTMLTLGIAGLVLGRKALWITWVLLLGCFCIGFHTAIELAEQWHWPLQRALRDLPTVLITYTLVAIILDRTVAALRESLAEAKARQVQLQSEMHARERAQAQLLHAQKMEATGRLASGVAHDFQNVLDLVLGFAAQRHAGETLSPQARERFLEEAMEGVETAAGRGTALTRKLLGFARQEFSRQEVFDATDALEAMRPMLRQTFPPSVRLHYQLPEEPLFIRLDRGEFDLMLLNIAANARDAMPDGGQFSLACTRAGAELEMALTDTGSGMSPEVLRQVFEPFFTTKPGSGGTGLGLSVIHDLVFESGGRIDVDSMPGHGTTFTVRLPLAQAPVLQD